MWSASGWEALRGRGLCTRLGIGQQSGWLLNYVWIYGLGRGRVVKITALAVIWRSCDFIPSTNTGSAFNLTAHKVLFTRYLDLIRFLTRQAIA